MTYFDLTKSDGGVSRVSIVIPVYNEADRIGDCLRAIAAQTVRPHEVIVVDNNSSDGTAVIAASFPFVRVLSEPRQGVVHARNTGFNAASGDILGRIDADSVIAENWVETLQNVFCYPGVDAVSGKITYYDMAEARLVNAIDLFFRRRFARLLGREMALQGANMALRRSAWHRVRAFTCSAGGLHEDFDLAIHLTRGGFRVALNESLEASISLRQAEYSWRNFTAYVWLSPRTYALHGLKSQRHMYPAVVFIVLFYYPIRLLHHGYDAESGRFTWRALLSSAAQQRVNPATFVD